MLKQLIQDSPFDQRTVFEAIRIRNHFANHGVTLDDIAAAKEELIVAQNEEMRQMIVEKLSQKSNHKPKNTKKKTDTSMRKYDGKLKCPDCGGRLYRENVCPGCAEGRAGKKVRLTCENIPECKYQEAI